MPKYRFKDNEMTFSDVMDIFTKFEDMYAELPSVRSAIHLAEKLHSIIIELNENIEMSDVEMYDEEKNGAIIFSIRSKYKNIRTIQYTKIDILSKFYDLTYANLEEVKLLNLALAYINALEYFFTYSYMVRDEVKNQINSKYGYFKQSPAIPCDGEDTGV